jgi:hypothetical protein
VAQLDGRIVSMQRLSPKGSVMAMLDDGAKLLFTPNMLRRHQPMVGSTVEARTVFPRNTEYLGEHYFVSKRWRITSPLNEPVESFH